MTKGYLTNLGMVSAVIADMTLNRIYELSGETYIGAVEQVTAWSKEFCDKHKSTDWEKLLFDGYTALSDRFNTTIINSWDEVVMDFAEFKFQQHLLCNDRPLQPVYEFNFLSPDGITITEENYESIPEAISSFSKWMDRYKDQGYYSSNAGRIDLDSLPENCQLLVIKDGVWAKHAYVHLEHTVEDIVKIVDVSRQKISQETFDHLQRFIEFRDSDSSLSEHLINIWTAVESWDAPEDLIVRFELDLLSTLCNEHDAAYIRFV